MCGFPPSRRGWLSRHAWSCVQKTAVPPRAFIRCFWVYHAHWYSLFIPVFFIKTFLKAVFTAKLRERSRDFPWPPDPQTCTIFPFTTPARGPSCPHQLPLPRVAHGVQLKGLHWVVTNTRSQHPTLGPSLGVAVCESEDTRRRRGTPQPPAPWRPRCSACPSSPSLSYSFLRKHLRYKWLWKRRNTTSRNCTALCVFPRLHDNIQDSFVNNRQMRVFNFEHLVFLDVQSLTKYNFVNNPM